MNVLGAILRDSLQEARDRRALAIVGLLTIVAVAFCFGISFRERSDGELLIRGITELGRSEGPFHRRAQSETADRSRFEAPRNATPAEGWDERVSGGVVVAFTIGAGGSRNRGAEAWTQYFDPASPASENAFAWIAEQLREEGWDEVAIRRSAEDPQRVEVAAMCRQKSRLAGAFVPSLFYGLVEPEGAVDTREGFVLLIQKGLTTGLLGGVGIFLALLLCSGFVPSMLAKGTLDLSLARPVGRVRLLLYKYLGGLWFIAGTAVLLVVGTWFALGVRTGVWDLRYLAMAPIAIAIFAVLYAPVVLIGVRAKSANIAGLAGIAVWWISAMIVRAHQFNPGFEGVPSVLRQGLLALYYGSPKTSHISDLGSRFLLESRASDLGGSDTREMMAGLAQVDWTFSIGTTVAFTAVCLLLACWHFRRTDY